jgi:class 3 adenylate cyclase/tetratricopeptide (TPR) repeat protein
MLPQACAHCGFANKPSAKFCGGCGVRRAAVPAPDSAQAPIQATESAQAPSQVPAGERRPVTVLFADLSGYTRLSSELDVEEVHSLVKRVLETVDAIVDDYGGTVDKHIGDAVMAVFGAPVAHGDDPVRAVRAACDMHQAMVRLSGELGRTLRVHIGIASGEVVAAGVGGDGHEAYTVVGESVNLAARLDDRAKPAETLISDAVHGAVSDIAHCEPLGEVSVKGLARPVPAWRVRELKTGTKDPARGPLVGRSSELAQFSGVLGACRQTGTGQAALVRGEAGIGKTRLVEEFIGIAGEQGFACHRGLILDFGVGKGQDAIRAVLRSLLNIPAAGTEAERQAAVEAGLERGLFGAAQRVFVNDLLELEQPVELRAVYDAMENATRNAGKQAVIGDLIAGASAEQPMVLAVEDVHWADSLTLAHLAAMTQRVNDCPAVLVMTTRIEGDPLDQGWRATTHNRPLMTVDLGPLRESEALRFAAGFVGAAERYVADCVARAEGNPLFLEQLLRNAEMSRGTAIPASIQSLVLARFDRLEPGDKQALQAASTLGQRFSLEALRHLIEDPGYTCKGLIEHYLVRPEGEDILFAHALIKEGIQSSLLKPRARTLHRRAAEWYAERDPVLHAQHLDRAEDPGAPRAYLDAAQAQAGAYHFERALELVVRGLEVAGTVTDGDGDAFVLTCMRGELLHDLGSIGESIEAYRAALELADDDTKRCRAWIGVAAGMRIADRFDEAFEALNAAQSLAEPQGQARELSRIHYYRGNLYFPLGNFEGCLEEQQKAIAYAREVGAADSEARALSGLGDAYYSQGRMITALDYFQRCVALCRQHGFGRIEVGNRYMVAWNRVYRNELQGSLEDALGACEAAALVGHRRAEIVARLAAGRTLYEIGDHPRAKAELDHGLALVEELGAARFKPFYMMFLGRIAYLNGDGGAAVRAIMNQAFEISQDTGATFVGPWVLSTLARVSERPDERRRCLEDGEVLLRAGCVGHNYLAFYPDAIQVALDDGDWDAVEGYASALEDYTSPEPLPRTDFFIARGRALAAFGRGARDPASVAELRRLRDQAEQTGLKMALPALDRALAEL